MDPNDLPLWLWPIQAIILLATGDVALAERALPDGAVRMLGGHPAAIPVEGWKPLSRRIKDERRAILQQYLEYTGSRPPRARKEPLSGDQRAQLAGEPSELNGGFSLTHLAIQTGRSPELQIKRLVDAARAGHVRTVDRDGNNVGPELWSCHSMREALERPGVLIMAPEPFHQIDEDTAVEPLFSRDDVLRLGSAQPSQARVWRAGAREKDDRELVGKVVDDLKTDSKQSMRSVILRHGFTKGTREQQEALVKRVSRKVKRGHCSPQ
jgi:hypothetical protein